MASLRPALPRPGSSPDLAGRCQACAIRELSICSVLSANELDLLCRIVSTIDVDPGQTIISEGEPARDLFNVVRGSLKLYKLLADGRRQVTGFLFPGDFLGIALSDAYAYSAEAIEPVQLCRFPRKKLEMLLGELPRLERKLLGTTAHELAVAQDQIVLLGRKTARERVASFLVSLSGRALARGRPATPLDIPMTRSDMADYLGLTSETVSRTLTQLRKAKIIGTTRSDQIDILDRKMLAELADEVTDG